MKKLLIVGGSGFFGKSFIDYFNVNSFKKWGIDEIIISSRTKQKILGIETVIYDSKVDHTLPEAEYIIYAASSTNPNTYRTNPDLEINQQTEAINKFKKIIDSFANPPKKIIYLSSGAVYGQSNLNKMQTDERFTKLKPDDHQNEKKFYAKIKSQWENFLLSQYPEQSIIARCFAFIGPQLSLKSHFVMGYFINQFIQNKSIQPSSHHQVVRSYMHTDDLIEWLLHLLIHVSPQHYPIVNVGSDEAVEIHALANIFNQLAGQHMLDFEIDVSLSDRYVPNTSLASNLLGLKLKYNLKESINRTIYAHKKY
jgi:nucleoside-diphosphate-sugar epimerase